MHLRSKQSGLSCSPPLFLSSWAFAQFQEGMCKSIFISSLFATLIILQVFDILHYIHSAKSKWLPLDLLPANRFSSQRGLCHPTSYRHKALSYRRHLCRLIEYIQSHPERLNARITEPEDFGVREWNEYFIITELIWPECIRITKENSSKQTQNQHSRGQQQKTWMNGMKPKLNKISWKQRNQSWNQNSRIHSCYAECMNDMNK